MQNFLDALKLVYFPIHKEGFKFILIFALVTILLALLNNTIGLIGLVLTLWCIFFFRDPERVIPTEENVLVSPADGLVTKIESGVEAPAELGLAGKKYNKVSIFLNVFNVHVNRIPIAGKIKQINYQPGQFLSANLDEASTQNERNSIILQTKSGTEIVFAQVAGLVARRIICDAVEGQEVKTGDRYGIIRFGSRADIYLPQEVEIKTLVGQTMIGGETIIAKISK
jgi:phosphatidylserine decarboxylase